MKHLMLMLISTLILSLTAACGAAPADEPAAAQAEADTAAAAELKTNSAPAESGSPANADEDVTLKLFLHFYTEQYTSFKPILAEFEAQTGARVEVVQGIITGDEGDQYFEEIVQRLDAGASDIDVYLIDVIWPGILAEHAVNLYDHIPRSEFEVHNPAILDHYSVGDRLVGLPMFVDVGLLFYRTDLLEKYGFAAPPATWDELEAMAQTIQEGERAAGNEDFWGYVWQGNRYEGLTCDALEWQVSHGGGQIIEPDGVVSVNNPQTIAAFERAAGWIGTISPPEVTTYNEDSSISVFKNGNAAFMRQWPWFWDPDVRADLIDGPYGVAVLPSGGHGTAATLGGWGMMASKYSEHPELAAKLVLALTGLETQRLLLEMDASMPSIDALYHDPDILAADPYIETLAPVVNSAVPRPSTITGEQYAEVSAAYYNTVHDILTGKVPAAEGVAQLEAELVDITGFEAAGP